LPSSIASFHLSAVTTRSAATSYLTNVAEDFRDGSVQDRFIALLKPAFKSSNHHLPDSNLASLAEGPAAGDMLFELGMCSVGRDMPVDLLARVSGSITRLYLEAIRLRRDIACQLSDAEIAAAQRRRAIGSSAIVGARRPPPRPEVWRGAMLNAFLGRPVWRNSRLSDEELVHAEECARRFDLVPMPAVEVE
jgi:hypothetical protein